MAQQRFDHRAPLFIEMAAHDWFSSLAIPILGIRLIIFATVEIGVHPRAFRTGDVLRDLVRAVPVAASLVPQRFEHSRQTRGGLRLLQRFFERLEIHASL
jgi:hypothetical protein